MVEVEVGREAGFAEVSVGGLMIGGGGGGGDALPRGERTGKEPGL